MVLIPEHVREWLSNKLPNLLSRTGMKATEQAAIPFELIREPIINALVHRDYEIKGAKCHLTTQLTTTAPAYSEALGFDERKTQRQLRKYMDLGLIRCIGPRSGI